MTKQNDNPVINDVLYRPTLHQDAFHLCDGRDNLPLRVMVGRIKGEALVIDRLLNYPAHVAVLGLVSTGIHRHDAALMVVTKNAGAFQGTPDQFETWRSNTKRKIDPILATILPDGAYWVIWNRKRKLKTDVIPMVNGWDGSNFTNFEFKQSLLNTDHATIH